MAEGNLDLVDDLIRGGTTGGNSNEKVHMASLDDSKDQAISDNSIPLSPQWLKLSKETRQPNSLQQGASSDTIHKDSWQLDGSQDKKEWRRNVPEIEGTRRWREEERDTGLLGRRERRKEGDRENEYRKNDRRYDSNAIRESADSRPSLASDRWHEVTGRNSAHEGRRDSKWSSRWGPEDKDKDSRKERKIEVEKEDQSAEKQSFTGNSRSLAESDARDKWRPRHRQEAHSGGSAVYRAAPGFGLERGRVEGSNVGFAPGRGRASFNGSLPLNRASTTAPIGAASVNGKSPAMFRYPRGKLLDIYRKQSAMPGFDKIPLGLEDVPQITQSSIMEPLAFVIPDSEEGDLLDDISNGKITSSETSQSTNIQKKLLVKDGERDVGDMILGENKEKPFTNLMVYGTSHDRDTGLLHELDYSFEEIDKVAQNGFGSAALTEIASGGGVYDHIKLGGGIVTGSGQQAVRKNVVNETGSLGDQDSLAELEGSSSSIFSFNVSSKLPDLSTSFDELFMANGQFQDGNVRGIVLEPTVPPEEMSLFYRDPQGEIQGPFLGVDIISWFDQGFFGLDLPVCLSDAPEGTPFQPLGELMPQLKLDSSSTAVQHLGEQSEALDRVKGKLEVDTHASDFVGSFSSSDNRWTSSGAEGLFDPHTHPGPQHKDSIDSRYDRLHILSTEKSLGIPSTETHAFHDFAGQDVEEVLYTGRPPSSMEYPLGKLAVDLRELSHNPSQLLAEEMVQSESSHNFPSDNDLNPLELLWSELEAAHTKHPLSSNLANVSDRRHIMNPADEGGSSFSSIGDPTFVRDARSVNYRRNPSSNMLHDDTRFELEANNCLSLEEHLFSQQLQKQQQQQIQQQQRMLSRQNSHLSVPFLEQVQGSLQRQQSMNQSMPPELEHLLKLQLQEQHHIQQLQQQQQQQHHQQQQQIQHQMQLLQQQQQDQLLFEHLLQQQLHNPGFGASHVDQVLFKQRLLHELQQQAHNIPRHHEPSIEDLIEAKLGHSLHPEYHNELLEQQRLRLGLQQELLTSHPRHRSLLPMEQLLFDLQQEQLQNQQFPHVSRQQVGIDKERNASGVWSVDESGQFIRTGAGLHQAHSGRLNQLDFVQPLQRPSSYEQPSQLERNFMLLERSQRGNYETNYQPFDRIGSISAGSNVDVVNALGRLQGLDELPGLMHQSVQRGQFPSRSVHQNHVPNQFSSSHLDVLDNNWPEHSGQLSNSSIESHFYQLHLEAEKQERDTKVNSSGRDPSSWGSLLGSEDNSNQGLAALLHRNMALQSSQALDLGDASSPPFGNRDPSWSFSHPASDRSFNFNADTVGLADSYRDTSFYNQVGPEQPNQMIAKAEGHESSGRLVSRSNSGALFEHNQLFPNMDELEKEHVTDSLGVDIFADGVDPLDSKEDKRVKKHGSKGNLSKSVMDLGEIGAEQAGGSVMDQVDLVVSAPMRYSSFGSTGEGPNVYNYNVGVDNLRVDNAHSGDLVNRRIPGILVRGADASSKLSFQNTGCDVVSAPPTKGKTPSALPPSEGGRRELRGNPLDAAAVPASNRKDIRFRQTLSTSTTDAPEASSFIDMLKSTKKMVPQEPESGVEHDGGKGNNKRKGKKGRQIDPSLLGFKVHSNRIMMGEIQRPDD